LKNIYLTILAAFSILACSETNEKAENSSFVFEQNFDQSPTGSLTTAEIKKDWFPATFLWGIKDRINYYIGIKGQTPEIVGTNNKQLLLTIPANTAGPIPGMQWSTKFNKTYKELFLQYEVKFDSNFNFVKGGKLPGLAGGKANTGGIKPTGKDGWSTRMMFWSEGKLCFWIYHKDQPGTYGDSLFFKKDGQYFQFKKGELYTIKHHIKINDPDKNNGLTEGFVNDSLYAFRNNLQFSTTEQLAIDQLIFSVFLGGEEKEYQY
jgi:hypothetical protein